MLGGKGPGWHGLQNKNNYYTTKLTLNNSSMDIETDHWLLFSFIR
jgi:hypothetical protein